MSYFIRSKTAIFQLNIPEGDVIVQLEQLINSIVDSDSVEIKRDKSFLLVNN